MRSIALALAAIFSASACVGIIEDAQMDFGSDGGQAGPGASTTSTTSGGETRATGSTGSAGSSAGITSSGAAGYSTSGIGGAAGATGGSTTGLGFGGASGVGGNTTTSGGGSGGQPTTDGGMGGNFGGAGGGGSGGRRVDAGLGGGTTATFTQVKAIIQTRCSTCHSNFTTYNTLMTHTVGQCGNDKLAKANDPANSAFLELVQGQGCGGYLMPRGCSSAPCISSADIQTFTNWINAGAPNN